jgi:hypothetical protein
VTYVCDIYHDDDAVAAVEVVMWQPLLRKLRILGLNSCTLNFDEVAFGGLWCTHDA